jgi:transcriptional regulator with XRE-family HTH domain
MHGLSQEAFAEMAHFSYKYYQAIESGRQRDIQLSTIERLAAAYGLQPHELLAPQMPKATPKDRRKSRR